MNRNLLLVALLAFVALAAADKDFEEGEIFLKLRGQSGKIFLGRKTKDGKKGNIEKEGFTVEVKEIKETDRQGRVVNKPVTTLAKENFIISPLNRSASIQGVKAAIVKMNVKLKDSNATLTLTIIIFQNSGNVTFGDEGYEVQKDVIKLFVEVKDYRFCNGSAIDFCKNNDVGEYLDVAIFMRNKNGEKGVAENEEERKKRKGPKKPGDNRKGVICPNSKEGRVIRRCPEFRNLGKDKMAASNVTKVDGRYTHMPRGYPKFVDSEDRVMIKFRGGRFNDSIIFDPLIDLDDDDDDDDVDADDDDDDDGNHATSIQLNVFMFVAILAALLM